MNQVVQPTPQHAEVSAHPASSARLKRILDLIGLTLAIVLTAWTVLSAQIAGGGAGPIAGLVVACVVVHAIARILGSGHPSIVPTLVVLSAFVIASASLGDTFSREPLSGPFGYVNAKAAYFVLAVFAALMLAAAGKAGGVRAIAGASAVAFALVPIWSRAWTGTLVVLALPVLAFILFRIGGARHAILGCVAAFLLVFLATTTLGAIYPGSDRSGSGQVLVRGTVSERRLMLWNEAIRMMMSHPSTGVGPGRFQTESTIAQYDSDARWAHHEFLQMGAEAGLIGLALVLLVFVWGFAGLWAASDDSWMAVLGAGTLAALGIQACMDYVLHFPAIPLVAAALTGSATGASRHDPGVRWLPTIRGFGLRGPKR